MDYEAVKPLLVNTIPWVTMSDVRVDILEERHARLSLPVREKHLNHVGIVYAGSHFMLMEVAGAALFICSYGLDRFVPVNRGMSIEFLKPAVTDLICDLTITEEKAREMIAPVEARGKGDWILEMSVTDESETLVSRATCNYYIIPMPVGLS